MACEIDDKDNFNPFLSFEINSEYQKWSSNIQSLINSETFTEGKNFGYNSVLNNGEDTLSVVYHFNTDGLKSGSLRDITINLAPDTSDEWNISEVITDTTRISKFRNWFVKMYGQPDNTKILNTLAQTYREPHGYGVMNEWELDSLNAQLFISIPEFRSTFEDSIYTNVWFRIYTTDYENKFEEERYKYLDTLSSVEDYLFLSLKEQPMVGNNDDPEYDIFIGYFLEGIYRKRNSWYDYRTISEIAFTIYVKDTFGREIHSEDFEYTISQGLGSEYSRFNSLYNVHNLGTRTNQGIGYSDNLIAQTALNSRHPENEIFLSIRNNPDRFKVEYKLNAIAFSDGTYINEN